jgi:hypothetical protein
VGEKQVFFQGMWTASAVELLAVGADYLIASPKPYIGVIVASGMLSVTGSYLLLRGRRNSDRSVTNEGKPPQAPPPEP